jgi:ATP-dependent DNA helicase RecG
MLTATENVTENVTENRLDVIKKLIVGNPKITTIELSKKLNVTRMTVFREIEKLKGKGEIKRIDPDKRGHWEVIQ